MVVNSYLEELEQNQRLVVQLPYIHNLTHMDNIDKYTGLLNETNIAIELGGSAVIYRSILGTGDTVTSKQWCQLSHHTHTVGYFLTRYFLLPMDGNLWGLSMLYPFKC